MENENQQSDKFKNYVLLALTGLCVILACFVFFGKDESYKSEVEKLRADNKKLQDERALIDSRIDSLKAVYDQLDAKDRKLEKTISEKDAEISKLIADSKRSKTELDKIRKEISEALKKIEEAKKNPPNREGQDLLNSLKIKTRK